MFSTSLAWYLSALRNTIGLFSLPVLKLASLYPFLVVCGFIFTKSTALPDNLTKSRGPWQWLEVRQPLLRVRCDCGCRTARQ